MTEDPHSLWQKQTMEGFTMDLDRVRALARAHDARTRRSRAALAVVALGGACLAAYLSFTSQLPLARSGEALLATGFIAFLWVGWRAMQPAPGQASAQTCVAFLRMKLLQRRTVARGGWLLRSTLLAPGLGVTLAALAIASGRDWRQLAPLIVLIVAWLVGMLMIQRREAAKVDAEIAELDRLSAA